MSADSGVIDPRDARPAAQRAVAQWLAVQARFAFEPALAAAWLAADPDPRRALRAVGAVPLPPDALEQACAELARAGARLLPLPARAYPPRLRRLSDAAPLLSVRGDAQTLSARAVAVVGPRAPTAYGCAVAEALAGALAGAGRVVVSGLARGIDACAHRAALAAGGRSVAVLGCGIDRVYPAEHRRLAEQLAEQGAVISEFPLGTPPVGAHFPLRNRLISGLAEAVVVVEARERSGSLVTARLALDQGVEVLAVPGPIDAPTSRGTNRLIYEGATPVLGARELLAELGAEPAACTSAAPSDPAPELAPVLAALRERPRTRDELARALRSSPERLAAPLLELELDGRVVEDRDGRLRCVSPLRSPRL